jgi:hypothetical protein
VVFAGGGGLELLMQPASNPAATIALNNAFIFNSRASQRLHFLNSIVEKMTAPEAGADHPCGCRCESYEYPPDSYSM